MAERSTREDSITNPSADLTYFSEDLLATMDEALDVLLDESNAVCALVIDRSGCILSSCGSFEPIDRDNMGAVAAGVVAALTSMVAQASSPEVSVKLYGADPDKVHFMVVGNRLILCVLYTRQTTTGQIRAAAKSFAQALTPLLSKDATTQNDTAGVLKSVQYIESKLNDIFSDLM